MAVEVAAQEVVGDLPSSTLARRLLEGEDTVGTYLVSEQSDDLVILSDGTLEQDDDHGAKILRGDGSGAHHGFDTMGVRTLLAA